MTEPLFVTLAEAAVLLGVKTKGTVKRYGKEGRIVIQGTGNGQKVVVASIIAYAEGRSKWHAAKNTPDGSQEPELYAIEPRGRSRGKRRSRSKRGTSMRGMLQGRKLQNTSIA